MFANFSFNPSSTPSRPQRQRQPPAAARHPPSPPRTDSLSPTSSRSASPSRSPRYEFSHSHSHIRPMIPHSHHVSVTELAHKLGAHSLNRAPECPPCRPHPQPRRCASTTPTPTPPAVGDDDGTFSELDRSPRLRAERGAGRTEASCRRRQRQLHTRMQCDPQHLKALADLVEGMVQTGSQCFVYEAAGVASLSSGEEGGDVADGGSSVRVVGRRPSVEWAKGRAGVAKAGRGVRARRRER